MPAHNSDSMPYLRQLSFAVTHHTEASPQATTPPPPDRPQSTPRKYLNLKSPQNFSSPYSVLASTNSFDNGAYLYHEKLRDHSSPNLKLSDRPRPLPHSASPPGGHSNEKLTEHSSPNLSLPRTPSNGSPNHHLHQSPHPVEIPKRSMSVQQPNLANPSHLSSNHTALQNPAAITDTIRRPLLYQAKYGVDWSLDVFTLPHNAIRSECVDLYNILESIHARSHAINLLEMEEFNQWWRVFEIFLIEYFDFEADILFPTVFSHSVTAGVQDNVLREKVNQDLLLRTSLLQRKDLLLDYIRQLNGTFDLRRHVDITDLFQTLLDQVNQLVPTLLQYFHTEERHMSPILLRLHPQLSRQLLTRKYLSYIKRGENPHINLVLLSRWMQPDSKEKWIRLNIRGYSRLMHKRWEKRCSRTHGHIAFKFHRRLLRSVRSVAASRLRRRTQFAEEIDDLSLGSFPSQTGSVRSFSMAARATSVPRSTRRTSNASRTRCKPTSR